MAKTPGRDAVFTLLMKQQQYKCDRCGILQHATVYRQSNGSYYAVDSFEAEYMKAKGKTTFKVHLRMNFRDGDKTNFTLDNLFALCPACTATFLKEQKKDFRELALQSRVKANLSTLVNIKTFLMARCGVEISTRDTVALIDLLTQTEKDER
jgi:hypothetical protein